jgi:valyl-tRNA synthetase
MAIDLPTTYDPQATEGPIHERWMAARAFAATPDDRERTYVVMMPLPNVTGALHMGHAMDNVMQDILVRWHRMQGDNTLWMPGVDHAGIATQAVVEKRLFELEGQTRHDIGREALVQRIWDWKDQYQERIVRQLQRMGCSCDWDRARFTMDRVCSRAVRETFFRMFTDGLIYRGMRLVNWDCHLQTAVADDEIVYEQVEGHFWDLRYPVIDPQPGEPEHVTVATTRPETMLGDTAVACHPEPARRLEEVIAATRERLTQAPARERQALEAELQALAARRQTHLPTLEKLAAMARDGRMVLLPLQERPIPLILDEWAKPELGSGCVKITPGHDPNDHDVWSRHQDRIGIVNILQPDGTLGEAGGAYAGLDRFVARERVVADLEARGLLGNVEDHLVEIGHSDRSHTPIEPYLSEQWFVRMGDVEGGIVGGRGTDKELRLPGLAQAAIDAVADNDWRSPTGLKLRFHPDHLRYSSTYLRWLEEKRDWCISRQLWWGHRIPIWSAAVDEPRLEELRPHLDALANREDLCIRLGREDGASLRWQELRGWPPGLEQARLLVCLRRDATDAELASRLEELGLPQDPDVLDTWFSSALWPHSTLGWPDPATADGDPGQSPFAHPDWPADTLATYFPGDCLVTARDIITLWVARMVLTGLYNLGDLPFDNCFVHANIQDGKGERMSKSKGNGIDPEDIIEEYGTDAIRYVLADMQTGSQDIRLPVQAVSPFTGNLIDLATAKHGRNQFTYLCPETGQEFDVLGTMPDLPPAKLLSDRFKEGRNFCNKLWNAARFVLSHLEGAVCQPRKPGELALEDRWILSRLSRTIATVHAQLQAYNPSAAIGAVRDFFWGDFCDWYVELTKPRLEAETGALARQVLAFGLDQSLRLLHPFLPFITEGLWGHLATLAPERGIHRARPVPDLLIHAPWPTPDPAWEDAALEGRVAFAQEVTRAIRDVRGKYGLSPKQPLEARIRASGERAADLEACRHLIAVLANLSALSVGPEESRTPDSATAVVGEVEAYLPGVVDLDKERARLEQQRQQLHGRIAGAEKKLANEGFTSQAPAAVVARERDRLEGLRAELQALDDSLAALG